MPPLIISKQKLTLNNNTQSHLSDSNDLIQDENDAIS